MTSSLNPKQETARTRDDWLRSTRALCNAFANHSSIEQIIDCFTSSQQDNILLFEHGLPELAPFVGRAFQGTQGIRDYFGVVSEHLSYKAMSFSDYSVDTELAVVSVRGSAEFTCKSTGKHWNECFIYRIQLDDDGKIVVYEVWADTGAAYLASSE